MDVVTFAFYLAIGKLSIYLLQLFPLARWIARKRAWSQDLFECDLCLGVWVYFALAWIFDVNITQYNGYDVLMYFITGAISSFVMHLFSLGWNAKFQIVEIK